MKKSILMGIMGLSASALLGLQGCGGSSSSPTTTPTITPKKPPVTVQLSGAVVDWYIAGALVFADLNSDGVHQAGIEPSVRTDANGFYDVAQLQVDQAASYNLVAKGGTDKATNNYYAATLLAESHYKSISPLTTLDTLLITKENYGSAEADSIVQKLIGMEDKEDTLPLDTNPAADKHLLAGSRMLAMYNTVLVEVLSQVIKPDPASFDTVDDVKIKLSREAWIEMAVQVAWDYEQELAAAGNDVSKVEPKIRWDSLQYMVDRMLKRYPLVQATTFTLMPKELAKAVVDYVEFVTDDDFISGTTRFFGTDGEEDDVYMSTVQTNQDQGIVNILNDYLVNGITPIYTKGDDDKDEYDDHHD